MFSWLQPWGRFNMAILFRCLLCGWVGLFAQAVCWILIWTLETVGCILSTNIETRCFFVRILKSCACCKACTRAHACVCLCVCVHTLLLNATTLNSEPPPSSTFGPPPLTPLARCVRFWHRKVGQGFPPRVSRSVGWCNSSRAEAPCALTVTTQLITGLM